MKSLPHDDKDFWMDSELCSAWDRVNFLWNTTGHFYDIFAWSLAVCSGLRREELISLEIRDCDTVHGVVHVANGKGSKPRDVELIPEFLLKFRDRIESMRARGDKYVFQPWGIKRHLSIRRANTLFDEALEALKLRDYWMDGKRRKPMKIHAARRTFATWARLLSYQGEDGEKTRISLEGLQAQLGHSKLENTLKYYARSLVGNRWTNKRPEWPAHI